MPSFKNVPEHFPTAYSQGTVEFFYRTFQTDPRALIPRFETESLVREALRYQKTEHYETCVDVGTGSWILAISIGLSGGFDSVFALDISEDALSLAAENASRNGLSVTFGKSDLLSGLNGMMGSERMCVRKPSHTERFSNTHSSESTTSTHPHSGTLSERHPPSILFVANLPYVRDNDPHVSPDTAFEPPQALYGGKETGFETTARFLSEFEAFVWEFPEGRFRVMCEVGDDHEAEIAKIGRKYGREVTVFPDLSGVRRFFTYAVWPKGA